MNRIQNIKTFAMEREAEKALEEANKQIELNMLAYQIECLWSRAKELIDVANACLENNIDFPHDKKTRLNENGAYVVPYDFVSSGIDHHVGFGAFYDRPVTCRAFDISYFNAISKRGGGYSEYELDLCNGKVYYSGRDAKYAMEKFLAEFDDFEASFYAWIDNLTNCLRGAK